MGKKKKSHEGGGGHERWLLTYADMITLLVAFFVMLYSISILDLKKFQAVAGALRMNFGGDERTAPTGGDALSTPGYPDGPNPILAKGGRGEQMASLASNVKKMAKDRGFENEVSIYRSERGVIIRIAAEGILFDIGRADLRSNATPVLAKLAQLLADKPYQIRVEGHTCNIPTRGGRFPSNWELSAARASTVVRFLVENGVEPTHLSAVGFADSQPIASQDEDEGRRKNRRVDIVISKSEHQNFIEQILGEIREGSDNPSNEVRAPKNEADLPVIFPKNELKP